MECGLQAGIMASLRHANVVLFMGLCPEPPLLVMEWCSRGSLFDLLNQGSEDPAMAAQLTWARRLGMALDGAKVQHQLRDLGVQGFLRVWVQKAAAEACERVCRRPGKSPAIAAQLTWARRLGMALDGAKVWKFSIEGWG